jgi:RecA/RadA recombinase
MILVIPNWKTPLHAVVEVEAATETAIVDAAEVVTMQIATYSLRSRHLRKHLRLTTQTPSQSQMTVMTVGVVVDATVAPTIDRIVKIVQNARKTTSGHSRSSARRMKRQNSSSPSFSTTSWEPWASWPRLISEKMTKKVR